MITPTPEITRAAWTAMQTAYNTKTIRKDDSDLMALVGTTLGLLGVIDKDRFMKGFTTTINRAIYVPFEIGVDTPEHPLWSQLVICAHEHQHVEQVDREGWATFAAKYVCDHAARAVYEAEAYRCNIELQWWNRRGDAGWSKVYAKNVQENYGCDEADAAVVEAALNLAYDDLRQNDVIVNAASIKMIQILRLLGATEQP